MKTLSIMLAASLLLFTNTGCKKETMCSNCNICDTCSSSDDVPLDWRVRVHTNDLLVFLPDRSGFLAGTASWQGDVKVVASKWRKISGPASFQLLSANQIATKVTDLEKGVYQFELSATVTDGSAVKDTASVTVGEMPAHPQTLLLEDKSWSGEGLGWGSQITIDLYQFIPAGNVFKAYIKRASSASWIELILNDESAPYSAEMKDGIFSVWSTNEETDSPDIRIEY